MAMKKTAEKKTEPAKEMSKEDKRKALDTAIANLEKTYGEGSVMRLGQASALNVEAIPTGSMTLDMALGIGGVPRGRIVEIYGPESSGKTTVALSIVAQAQKLGGEVAFIDVEHALDPTYAASLGVDIDSMLVSQPDSGEQALEIAEALVRSGALDVIVLDSVAAMVTKAEIDGEMGDTHVGQLARLMSQAMRKLTSVIAKSRCVAIFINQVREKIGVIYGNPETTPGGRALKFYSSVRIEVRKGEILKSGSESIGNRTRCKVVKHTVAPPFKEAEFDMLYGKGVSRIGEVVDIATELDIIHKAGAWFSYEGNKIGQGRENTKEFLLSHPDMMAEVEEKILAAKMEIIKASAKQRKEDALKKAAKTAVEKAPEEEAPKTAKKAAKATASVIVDAEDDFEEFTPAE